MNGTFAETAEDILRAAISAATDATSKPEMISAWRACDPQIDELARAGESLAENIAIEAPKLISGQSLLSIPLWATLFARASESQLPQEVLVALGESIGRHSLKCLSENRQFQRTTAQLITRAVLSGILNYFVRPASSFAFAETAREQNTSVADIEKNGSLGLYEGLTRLAKDNLNVAKVY